MAIDVEHPFANPPLGPQASISLAQAARTFFGFAGPKIIVAAALVAIALRVSLGHPRVVDALAVAAILVVWCFQEWWAHKHLLHLKPFTLFGRRVDLYFAHEHRRHHRTPWDVKGALLPLRVLLPAIPLSAALFWLVAPDLATALSCMAAYSSMALVYEWTHYLTHTPYAPRGALYRRICRSHRLHHFKNESFWYGFTVPFVDDLLRTAPAPSSVELSPTCKTLGVDE